MCDIYRTDLFFVQGDSCPAAATMVYLSLGHFEYLASTVGSGWPGPRSAWHTNLNLLNQLKSIQPNTFRKLDASLDVVVVVVVVESITLSGLFVAVERWAWGLRANWSCDCCVFCVLCMKNCDQCDCVCFICLFIEMWIICEAFKQSNRAVIGNYRRHYS